MSAVRAVVVFAGDGVVREVGPHGVRQESVRTARGYDELATRLGELLDARAWVFDGVGLPEPGGGTVVLCRSDGLHRLRANGPGPLDDVVLLDASRTQALRQAEELGLAAAMESDPYADWVTGRPGTEPALYGRLDVASALGARLDSEPLTQGDSYGRFQVPGVSGVAELLATYIDAICRTR